MGRELKPSEMHPDDLPDERAFQDEFTREFLQSVEETRPGYYPFLSKTGKYEMDFPSGGKIGNKQYSLENEIFEGLSVGVNNTEQESAFTLFYFGGNDKTSIDTNLDAFKKRVGERIEYKKIENNDKITFYSNFKDNDFDNHVAYIQNNNKPGAIELIYFIDCQTEKGCNKDNQRIFLEWIDTIQFIDVEKEGVENERKNN